MQELGAAQFAGLSIGSTSAVAILLSLSGSGSGTHAPWPFYVGRSISLEVSGAPGVPGGTGETPVSPLTSFRLLFSGPSYLFLHSFPASGYVKPSSFPGLLRHPLPS